MPFCLIDRVVEIYANEKVVGLKNITFNEEVLMTHFPDYPVYPGTMVVEAAAQLSGFLLEYSLNKESEEPMRAVLMQIEKAKFHNRMKPGDQLLINCELESVFALAAKVNCNVSVANENTAVIGLQFKMFSVPYPKIHKQQREIYEQWTREIKLDRPIL